MATVRAETILAIAAEEVGTRETAENCVKYNDEYYGSNGLSGKKLEWCCVFVWWVFHHANADELFFDAKKTASCTTLWRWAQGKGLAVTNGEYKPGDIVFFDWDGSGDCDHVGIVENVSGNTAYVIEGNWHNAVSRVSRPVSGIAAAFRPAYEPEPQIPEVEALLAQVTPAQAYELLIKAQLYAATLQPPAWLARSGELDKAIRAGITDGSEPCRLATRYEAALMAKRAAGK